MQPMLGDFFNNARRGSVAWWIENGNIVRDGVLQQRKKGFSGDLTPDEARIRNTLPFCVGDGGLDRLMGKLYADNSTGLFGQTKRKKSITAIEIEQLAFFGKLQQGSRFLDYGWYE